MAILASGKAPGVRCGAEAVDPQSVYALAPKAIKEIERGSRRGQRPISAKDIARYTGMSTDFMKKVWTKSNAGAFGCLLGLFALAGKASAADINAGITFQQNSTYQAADFNNLVGLASINSQFYSSKSVGTVSPATDYILLLSGSGSFYKSTWLSAIQSPSLISTLSSGIPATNDLFMYYSQSSTNALQNVNFTNLLKDFTTNLNPSLLSYGNGTNYYISNWPTAFAPNQTNNQPQFLVWGTNGVAYQQSYSNIVQNAMPYIGTNLNIPYVNKQIFNPWLVYGTNSTTNGFGYVTNFPITSIIVSNAATGTNGLATLATNDTVPLFSTVQGTNTTLTLNALAQYFVTNYSPTNLVFTGTTNITTGTWTTNFAHNLPYTPTYVRWSLVCAGTNATYTTNDEVDISAIVSSGTRTFSFWYNSTNIYLLKNATMGTIVQKDGANNASPLEAQWKPKCYYR